MFEGVYFEFPKLGFLLFVFLGCDQLCPLRTNPLLFPQLHHLSPPKRSVTWITMAQWGMIVFLIVALMSPIKETPLPTHYAGYQTLIIADDTTAKTKTTITTLIALRPHDAIGVYVGGIILPLTYDHTALASMVTHVPQTTTTAPLPRETLQFLTTHTKPWVIILSDHPQTWEKQLPLSLHDHLLISDKQEDQWIQKESRRHPAIEIFSEHSTKVYYYFYPLFLGFMALLLYLYGRNQRGSV